MKQLTLLCAMALLSFMACQKENASTTPIINTENYFPMKVGNYWIYVNSEVSSDGVETVLEGQDSVFIEKDTVINSKLYYKFMTYYSKSKNYYQGSLLRDSSQNILNEKGKLVFSAQNFTDTIEVDRSKNSLEMFKSKYVKLEKEDNVKSSSGIHNCVDVRLTAILKQPAADGDTVRYSHNYYANNVGPLQKTCGYVSTRAYTKRDLLRYKVQ
jgi:hypothetical protein